MSLLGKEGDAVKCDFSLAIAPCLHDGVCAFPGQGCHKLCAHR